MKLISEPSRLISLLIIGVLLVMMICLLFGILPSYIPTINRFLIVLWEKPSLSLALTILNFLGVLLLLERFPMRSSRASSILIRICFLVLFCNAGLATEKALALLKPPRYLGGVSYNNHEYHLFGVAKVSGPMTYSLYACNSIGWHCVKTEVPSDLMIYVYDIQDIETFIHGLPDSP